MKQDGILIKLDKELKDKFKDHCSQKKTTMTKMIENWIINELSSVQTENETSDFYIDLQFYAKEYQYLKNKISEMSKITRALTARTERRSITFYEKLLYRDFYNIEQFQNYQLISTYDMYQKHYKRFSDFPESIQTVIQKYTEDFEKIPYYRGSALATDPINHKLINIVFRSSYSFLNINHTINNSIDFHNLQTIFIITSLESKPKVYHSDEFSYKFINQNASCKFYGIEEIFPLLHDDEDEFRFHR